MTTIQSTKYTTFFYFFFNNNLSPFLVLAQSFLRAQGLGSAESGIVLLYSEHFGLSRIRRDREKESPKYKTNPIQTQTNPIFPRPNPVLSPKMRIFDKFRITFLCKTNPMVCLTERVITSKKGKKYQTKPIFTIS